MNKYIVYIIISINKYKFSTISMKKTYRSKVTNKLAWNAAHGTLLA